MVRLTTQSRHIHLPPPVAGEQPTPYDGQVKIEAEWARLFGLSKQLLHDRLARGWSVRDALVTKARIYRRLSAKEGAGDAVSGH